MYESIIVGRYVAAYASSRGVKISHTTLQKLLYIIYGTYLVQEMKPLFDEEPQAWPYGPIFESVRCHYADSAEVEIERIDAPYFDKLRSDRRLNKVLEKVLGNFGSWSEQRLIDWCRRAGAPWAVALSGDGVEYGVVIPIREIERYFVRLLNSRDKSYVEVLDISKAPDVASTASDVPQRTNPDAMSLAEQQGVRYSSDTHLRIQLVGWMMWFIPSWLALVLLVVALCDISDGVKMALLGTTTVNVLGLPLIVLRGLFDRSN